MSYFHKTEWGVIKIYPSDSKYKKYSTVLKNNETGKTRLLHWGDSRYPQYKDTTGFQTYTHLDHLDNDRKKRYIKRHRHFIKEGYFSPGYFSMKYLWS